MIVTHSSFEKIPLSVETRRSFIDEQIREVEMAIREQKSDRGTRLVKELEKVKRRLEAKLETLSANVAGSTPPSVPPPVEARPEE